MNAKDPGMSKSQYATKAGFAPKKAEPMQMPNRMDSDVKKTGYKNGSPDKKTLSTPGTQAGAKANPKPASGVTFGAKPGLHTAGKHGMTAPKGKPYPAVD